MVLCGVYNLHFLAIVCVGALVCKSVFPTTEWTSVTSIWREMEIEAQRRGKAKATQHNPVDNQLHNKTKYEAQQSNACKSTLTRCYIMMALSLSFYNWPYYLLWE